MEGASTVEPCLRAAISIKSVILLCVRWYLAYKLSLRDLEEMVAERGVSVDHSTVHRWVVRFSAKLLERFNRRKRAVTGKWHVDETYIKVRGQWMYLYRAIDSVGDTALNSLAMLGSSLQKAWYCRQVLKTCICLCLRACVSGVS